MHSTFVPAANALRSQLLPTAAALTKVRCVGLNHKNPPYMKQKLFGICGLISGLALTLTSIASAQSVPANAEPSLSPSEGDFAATGLPQIFDVWRPLKAHPRIAFDDSLLDLGISSSINWSGYADTASPAASDTIATVTGSWVVPAVTSTAGNGVAAYSAIWVGIDGFDDGTVEQLGTLQAAEVVTRGRGRNQTTTTETLYYAWIEMYPAGMIELPGTVKPGDLIIASVTWVGGSSGTCTLYMEDSTEGWTYGPVNVASSASAQDMSAEWVVEAPSSYFGVLPLADFGTVSLTGCSATIGGPSGPISAFNWDAMTMVTRTGTVKAAPSALNSSSTSSSFSVTWEHD